MHSQDGLEQAAPATWQRAVLRVLLSVPALWLLLHFSFVARASAAHLWPPGGTDYGVGTWFQEFPLHMNAFFGTLHVLQAVPLLPLIFLAGRGSRARWWLVIAAAPPQVFIYWGLYTSPEKITFWVMQALCLAWIWIDRRRPHTRPQIWLTLQCVICCWIVPYAIRTYDVIAH